MQTWPRSVGVFGRLINLQMYILAGVMGRQDLPNRALYLSKASIMRFPLGPCPPGPIIKAPGFTCGTIQMVLLGFGIGKSHRSNDIRSRFF